MREEASHVGRQHGFGSGGAARDQAEPSPRGLVLSRFAAGGMNDFARGQGDQHEAENG